MSPTIRQLAKRAHRRHERLELVDALERIVARAESASQRRDDAEILLFRSVWHAPEKKVVERLFRDIDAILEEIRLLQLKLPPASPHGLL